MIIRIEKCNLTEKLLKFLILISSAKLFFYGHSLIDTTALILEAITLILISINEKLLSGINVIVVFFIYILSLLVTMISKGGLGACLILINLFLLFLVFDNYPVSVTTYKKLHLTTAIVISLFIITCNTTTVYAGFCYTYLGNRINANMCGMISLAGMLHWNCYISRTELNEWIKTVLQIVITAVFGYYVLLFDCRSAMLSLIVFCAIIIFFKSTFSYERFLLIIRTVLFISILFTVLYIAIKSQITEEVIFGKQLYTGREIVWADAWKKILESPLFGNGTSLGLSGVHNTYTQSAHNMMLSILYVAGIIPALVVFWGFGKRLDNCNNRIQYDRFSQFALIGCLAMAVFESFLTESFIYIIFAQFLICYKDNNTEENT